MNSNIDSYNETQTFQSALGQAIALWSQGKNIPMTIAIQLMEDGYNVPLLERRYRKKL